MADVVPDSRRVPWIPGVDVGVNGGIEQYLPGGANERTTLIDVTASPYFAAGNTTETAGTIASGDDELTVVSATDFSVGNYVKVGLPTIQELEITAGCSVSGNLTIYTPTPAEQYQSTLVAVTAGDTAAQVATKIRAAAVNYWSLSGAGTTVIFTQTNAKVTALTVACTPGSTGVTSTPSETQAASIAVASSRISSIVGLVFTLADTAGASVAGAIVSHNDQPAIQAACDAVAGTGDVVYCPTGTYRLDTAVSLNWSQGDFTIRGDGPTLTKWESWGVTAPLLPGQNFLTEKFPIAATGDHFRGENTITFPDPETYLAGYPNGGVGAVVLVTIKNNTDPDNLIVSVAGFDRRLAYAAVITAVSSTDITIQATLPFDLPASLEPLLNFDYHFINRLGVEELWMSGLNSTSVGQSGLTQCLNSWFYDVKITDTENYIWGMGDSIYCEARKCDFRRRKAEGTNGAGIINSRAFNCLVEDNIITDIVPQFEINNSCVGNVVAFNFCYNSEVFGVIGGSINSNHAPENAFNLYEGNIGEKFQCDGYFGGAFSDTLYRNWFQGTNPFTDSGGYCIQLNRFTRNYSVCCNIVGNPVVVPGVSYPTYSYENRYPIAPANPPFGATDGDYDGHGPERFCFILGTPNIGNGGFRPYEPTADPQSPNRFASAINADWWGAWDGKPMLRLPPPASNAYNAASTYYCSSAGGSIVDFIAAGPPDLTGGNSILNWIANNPAKHGLATWDEPGPASVDWLPISANSFQEIDYDVINTLVRKGNYNYATNSIPASESVGGDTTPASLFRSSAPSWWGARPWPAFDPTDPEPSNNSIPAGERWESTLDPTAPTFVNPVSLSGTAQYNSELEITGGIALGVPSPTYTYSWLLDADEGQEIGTNQTLDLTNPTWVGHFVRGIKIATNGVGSPATSFADSEEILPFEGDVLFVDQVANAAPVTELWLRAPLTAGVAGVFTYYLVQHSGPYPTQPDNNFAYKRFGSLNDQIYVFDGTVSEAEAIDSVP